MQIHSLADTAAIILAAGNRQHLDDPGAGRVSKNLALIGDKPVISHVVGAPMNAGIPPHKIVVVVKPALRQQFQAVLPLGIQLAEQHEARGSADAIREVLNQSMLPVCKQVFILMGDQPTMRSKTLQAMFYKHQQSKRVVTVSEFKANRDHPAFKKCGIIIRDEVTKQFREIARSDAAAPGTRQLHAGPYLFKRSWLVDSVKQLPTVYEGEQHVYLAVQAAAVVGGVNLFHIADAWEALGVDTYESLVAIREDNRTFLTR